jgi:H+-translocating NAD(P) transhydrogenase subunit alpha
MPRWRRRWDNLPHIKLKENYDGPKKKVTMNAEILIASLYVFALAAFLGYQLISRVPPLLHTPLMSATNAISGISLVGSLVIAGAHVTRLSTMLGLVAVTFSTINVVGGFMITDRMLKMFKKKEAPQKELPPKPKP